MERLSDPTPCLRTDLATIDASDGPRAQRVIVDEISGRFSRVSDHVWKQLQSREADSSMWQEAVAAGWTRGRLKAVASRFSILAVRIPLGSVDRFAAWMAPRTNWLFSLHAVLFWSVFACVALLAFLSSHAQWSVAVTSLPAFLEQASPIGLAGVFVATKLVHELAHAIVCRRIGARCGEVGVLILCGMPCPYCDVTDVWRVPRAMSRCAVMLAGIYVEFVIASIALFGWVLSRDPAWQLFFVYVMLVCGVSTLLFNANPLMRYDGYFVLSDLVGVTNLRSQAQQTWMRLVFRIVGGPGAGRTFALGGRVYAFASYHLASSLYRCLITLAIASLVVHWAGVIQLRPVAVVFVAMTIAIAGLRSARRLVGVVRGDGLWSMFPTWRRLAVVGTLVVVVASLVLVPFPRFRRVVGRIEASDAVVVYVNNGGIIDAVDAEVGDLVQAGQRLASIRNVEVSLETVRLEAQLRLASLRRQAAERSALDRPEVSRQWEILRAAESATLTSVDSARLKERQNEIVAPVSGRVLPPHEDSKRSLQANGESHSASQSRDAACVERFAMLDGLGVASDEAWCRISPQRTRHVTFWLSGDDFEHVSLDDVVSVRESVGVAEVYRSQIDSISPVVRDTRSVTDQAWFEATCPLADVDDETFLRSMDASCDVVIRLANRSLAEDLVDWMTVWLRG